MIKTKSKFWNDSSFLKTLITMAIPISLQGLVSTFLNMADTVMISSLGSTEIAAVGMANQFVFFFLVICFGFSSGGSIFFSQYYGDGDIKNVRKYLTISLQFSVLVSIVFTTLAIFFSYQIIMVLIPDPEVAEIGSKYLFIIGLSFTITAISQVYNAVLRSINRPRIPLLISVVSFLVNIFFNYVLIFGKFGAPALGVAGAAIGTLIARLVEIVLLSILVFGMKNSKDDIRPLEVLKFDGIRIKKYFKIALPVILGEMFWSLGQLMFSVAYGRVGKDAAASIQLTGTIQNVFFIIVNALNNSAAILIGQRLGAEDKERAERYASYFLQINSLLGFLSLLCLTLAPDFLMKIYSNLEPQIYDMTIRLLIVRGIFIPFRFLNGSLFVGILRAGGQTRIPLIIELSTMWLFAIPMSFIGVLVFQWPIEIIFTIASLEEVIKFVLVFRIYKSKRWLNNITD